MKDLKVERLFGISLFSVLFQEHSSQTNTLVKVGRGISFLVGVMFSSTT